MPTVTPREFLKDYKANYKAYGHGEAYRILRQRITWKLGHAWYMANKAKIDSEVAMLELHMEEK
jgi:hypothetical protein